MVLKLIFGLIGGLGMFLYGMHLMSNGLQKSAGNKMRAILSSLTHNRFIAVGVGTFITMIIQSSSATTVMLVSFVESKLMTFGQTLGIMLGAYIGTTITAQVIAFKLTDYSLVLIGIGVFLISFINSEKYKNIGETILGFGLLFFGMFIMSDAMYPLRSYEPFIELLLKLENPLLGILVGTVFTALIQSSSAFIGIMIILATQGLLSLEASIPLVFGANLGTAITAILASINTHREARKVALAHTLFKVVGVLLFIWWIPTFMELTQYLSPKNIGAGESMAQILPRQIANAHTIFNVALTIIALPFTSSFARLIDKIFPPKKETATASFKIKHLENNTLPSSALALSLAKQETLRLSKTVQEMVDDILLAFFEKDKKIIENLRYKDNKVNFLRDEIKTYLIKISQSTTQEERVNEAFQILYTIKEFEQIADIISKVLITKAEEWSKTDCLFSESGKKELAEQHLRSLKQISRAIEVFRDVNLEKAKAMEEKLHKYEDISFCLERQHYERLKDNIEESMQSSKTHLELISMFNLINTHATNIAKILQEWKTTNQY